MSSGYDQNLLDEAPKATRAQMQEGYNVDLLDDRPARRSPSMRSPSTPVPAAIPLTPGIAETGSKEKFGSAAYVSPSRTSFWRTRNGIITIVVIALVIVGAVVGGAVGGTVGKKSNNKSLGGPTATGSDSSPSVAAVQPTSATINQGIGGADASQTAASASTTSPPLLSDGSGRPTSSLSGSGTFSLPFATSSIPAAGGAAVASDPSGGSEIVQQNS